MTKNEKLEIPTLNLAEMAPHNELDSNLYKACDNLKNLGNTNGNWSKKEEKGQELSDVVDENTLAKINQEIQAHAEEAINLWAPLPLGIVPEEIRKVDLAAKRGKL